MVLGLRGIPGIQGGVEKHAEQIYPLLRDHDCDIEIIGRTPYLSRKRNHWQGIKITGLWAPRVKGLEAFVHTYLGVCYAAIKRPDILHIHAVGPAIAAPLAKWLGLRVVFTHHGPDYDREKWGGLAKRILQTGEAWGVGNANAVISISNHIHDLIMTKYNMVSTVIPNGIGEPEPAASTDTLTKFGLRAARYVIMVSRMVPEKRHIDLISAFRDADLQGWKLAIVGNAEHEDNYARKLRKTAEQTPNVVLTGFQSGTALSELYSHAGVFVLPSSHEGYPIALLEALSYEIPVIASDIPANLEFRLPRSSYFALGDVGQLKERLREISSRTQPDAAFRDYVIDFKKKNSWKSIAKQTYDVYEQAFSSKRQLAKDE